MTNGRTAVIDAEDVCLVSKYKWSAAAVKKGFVYATAHVNKKTLYLHRLLVGAAPRQAVDHINHNTLDCRRTNLRLCGYAGNAKNRRANKSSRGIKGVTLQRGRWVAQIRFDGHYVRVGPFANQELAARGYDALAREFHGEFACTNFPKAVTA